MTRKGLLALCTVLHPILNGQIDSSEIRDPSGYYPLPPTAPNNGGVGPMGFYLLSYLLIR